MSEKKYIPDASGTVTVKGLETQVDRFLIEDAYLKEQLKELAERKEAFRRELQNIMTEAAPGARSIYFQGKKGGLRVTPPDLEKDGNRPNFSQETLTELRRRGGLDMLGLPSEEVVETRTEVVLKGDYAQRFLAQLQTLKDAGQLETTPDEVQIVERQKVRLEALAKLMEIASQQSESTGEPTEAAKVARLLLRKAVKAATVSGDEAWR